MKNISINVTKKNRNILRKWLGCQTIDDTIRIIKNNNIDVWDKLCDEVLFKLWIELDRNENIVLSLDDAKLLYKFMGKLSSEDVDYVINKYKLKLDSEDCMIALFILYGDIKTNL